MKPRIFVAILLIAAAVFVSRTVLSGELDVSGRLVIASDILPSIGIQEGQLQTLEVSLKNHDLTGFEKIAIGAAPEGCPTIYSSWHCDRLAESKDKKDTDMADQQRRLRKWGLLVLTELANESSRLSGIDVGQNRYDLSARCLFRLADWFAKGDGYGNIILAARCRSVSGVAIAHLIIQSTLPLADLQTFVGKMEADEDEIEYYRRLIRIHEREVPGCLAPFVKKELSVNNIGMTFGQGLGNAIGVIGNDYKIDITTKAFIGLDLEATRAARGSLPDKLAVFLGDPAAVYTSLKQWERYVLVPDFCENRRFAVDLSKTLLFRKAVGGFPLKPLPTDAFLQDGKLNPRYSSETEAAFSRAWMEFSQSYVFLNSDLKKDPTTGKVVVDPKAENLSTKYGNMNAGTTAARIYVAVKAGRFRGYHPDDRGK